MILKDLFAKRAESCASLLTIYSFEKKLVINIHNFKPHPTELKAAKSVKHYCSLSLQKGCMLLNESTHAHKSSDFKVLQLAKALPRGHDDE